MQLKLKKLAVAVAVVLAVGGMMSASSQTWTLDGGLTATLSSGTLTISGSGGMPDYNSSYPPWYNNSPGVSVRCTATKVVIEEGVTSIGNAAFQDCERITSVTISNSVTSIGNGAFEFDGMTSIDIPNSVISIGNNAFASCPNLTSVIIPNSVTTIGDQAFGWCDKLTSVIIGNSVTTIGDAAFVYCDNLTSVTSLNSVPPTLGAYVFGYIPNAKTTLSVPANAVDAYKAADGWKAFGTITGGAVSSISYRSAQVRANSSLPKISVRGRTLTVNNLQSSTAPIQLRVIDLRGRAVGNFNAAKSNVGTFTLSKMPAGKYLVEVRRSGVRLGTTAVMVR
jgi:hypothetical protein